MDMTERQEDYLFSDEECFCEYGIGRREHGARCKAVKRLIREHRELVCDQQAREQLLRNLADRIDPRQ